MFGKNEKGAATPSGGTLSFIGHEVTITGNIGGSGNILGRAGRRAGQASGAQRVDDR